MTWNRALIFLLLVVAAVTATVAPLAAKSGQNAGVFGHYDVTFKGELAGEGRAHVISKKVVFIKGDLLEGKQGGAGLFLALNLPLSDDGHFSGNGTFTLSAGKVVNVTIVGRVEPADGVLIKKPRIICTFTTATGDAGRIYGTH